ncbi:MAG: retropepsin-like aspartic protease [Phenylobacterium sp.]
MRPTTAARMIATLALAFAGPAAAQAPAPGPVPVMRAPSPPPAFTGERADVAMALLENRPTVEVSIGGRSLRFIVDTGATGQILVRPEIAEALALPVTGQVRVGDPSGQAQARRMFRTPSVKLGGLEFHDVATVELVTPPGQLAGVDGVLGLRTYADLLLTLDYARGRLKLEKGELPPGAMGYEVEGPGAITIPLTIGDDTVRVHLDSGNGRAPLVVPQAVGERHAKPGAAHPDGRASTLISSVELWRAELAQPAMLGGVRLPVREVAWPSLGPSGNLGSLALSGAVVRLDQKNRRLSIEFAKPDPSRPAA